MSAMEEEESGEAPCVSLRQAWRSHLKQLFVATLCTTTVCVSFNALIANLFLWAGREGIRRTGSAVPFNIYAWSEELHAALGGCEAFIVLYTVREVFFGVVFTAVQFYSPLWFIESDSYSRKLVQGLWAFVGLAVTFCCLSADLMQLSGAMDTTIFVIEPTRLAIDCVFFAPVLLFTYVWWFPRHKWLRLGIKLAFGIVAALTVYFAWRGLCYTFFRIESRVLRVVTAVVAPPVLFNIGFESLFPMSVSLSEKFGIDTGGCLLMLPMCFGMTMSNMLQLASPDFWTGFCIDILSVATELKMKHCLVQGLTPLEAAWCSVRACRMRPFGKASSRVMTGVMDPTPQAAAAPAWVSDEEDQGSPAPAGPREIDRAANPHVTSSSQTSQPSQQASATTTERREAFREEMLRSVAVNSNLPELVTQITIASYLLIANLNPNKVAGEPLNLRTMLALVGTKLILEIGVDFATVHLAARQAQDGYAAKLHASVPSISSLVILCSTACLWVTESLFLASLTYCAYPDEDGNLKSLGLCDVKDLS